MAELTAERVREVWSYDPITGDLVWKISPANHIKSGDVAGCLNKDGYIQCRFNKCTHLAHRLVFLWLYGRWPDGEIDHVNHLKTDNRIENLRDVSPQENDKNKKLAKNNNSGFTGVVWFKRTQKWRANIYVNKRCIHLGYFNDINDAISARSRANIEHNFHENHGSI